MASDPVKVLLEACDTWPRDLRVSDVGPLARALRITVEALAAIAGSSYSDKFSASAALARAAACIQLPLEGWRIRTSTTNIQCGEEAPTLARAAEEVGK